MVGPARREDPPARVTSQRQEEPTREQEQPGTVAPPGAPVPRPPHRADPQGGQALREASVPPRLARSRPPPPRVRLPRAAQGEAAAAGPVRAARGPAPARLRGGPQGVRPDR